MTVFEEFERDFQDAVVGLLPGAKCVRVVVTFVNTDRTECEVDITREGYVTGDSDDDDEADV